MRLSLNGMAVLRDIGANPRAFPDVSVDAAKAASSLVKKQIKKADLSSLREIKRAIGTESFALILDGLADKEIATLVKKFDKHHPDAKDGSAGWRRQHLQALAANSVQPSERPKAPPKAKKRTAPRVKKAPRETLGLRSMSARRGGR